MKFFSLKWFAVVIYLLVSINVTAQANAETFTFKGRQIAYEVVTHAATGIQKFYVVISTDKKAASVIKDAVQGCDEINSEGAQCYFITIPETITDVAEQEQLFTEFVKHITGRVKLLDSTFIVIQDKDYTGNYTAIRKNNNPSGYLNPIEKTVFYDTAATICKEF